MWERIITRYNLRRGSNPERTVKSLQSHWDFIRTEVTVFSNNYAQIIRENQSGMSDADMTTRAVTNFAADQQKQFGLLHCWELMKDEPKWQAPNVRDTAAAARGEGFGEEPTAATDTVDLGEGQSSPVRSGAHVRRPMGRDSAKAAKKKANSDAGSASSAEYASKMQELTLQRNYMMQEAAECRSERYQRLASLDEQRFEETRRHNEALLQIEQEKLRFMREQHEDDKRKEEKAEDERILKLDPDAYPPSLRGYYKICQEEILERKRRGRRQGP